jgi:CheY-like chemotaxis protein
MVSSESSPYILLVDDDDGLRTALAEYLADVGGYQVTPVTNGREALDHLKAGGRPCVILLDLMMPVMDGWEFRDAQRADPALADIPVLVITALGGDKPSPVSREHTLRKPLDPKALLRLIAGFC